MFITAPFSDFRTFYTCFLPDSALSLMLRIVEDMLASLFV